MFGKLNKMISDFVENRENWREYKREINIYKRDLKKLRQLEILEKLERFERR